ncbi:MAG: hypothetical protein ACE5KE_10910 [Methanosarcinales archaeon]
MFIPIKERQFTIWNLRRSGLIGSEIARKLKITRQAVSKALQGMDAHISKTLLEMAKSNQIEVQSVNFEKGILFGKSVPFNTGAIIFVSAKYGVQVWYEHDGNCNNCNRYKDCMEILWDLADEMNLKLQTTDDPTKLADELFKKLRRLY